MLRIDFNILFNQLLDKKEMNTSGTLVARLSLISAILQTYISYILFFKNLHNKTLLFIDPSERNQTKLNKNICTIRDDYFRIRIQTRSNTIRQLIQSLFVFYILLLRIFGIIKKGISNKSEAI